MIRVAGFDILTPVKSGYIFYFVSKRLSQYHDSGHRSLKIDFIFIGLSSSHYLSCEFSKLTQLT